MLNIRSNVFETNSSSSHSISINKDSSGIYETIEPDDNGIVVLNGGQFGWEYEACNDALTKANYLAVKAMHDLSIGKILGNKNIKMLKEAIIEHVGAKGVNLNLDVKDYSSYIDHQSVDVADHIFADKESVKKFIFDKGSYLFTGNDNNDAPPNFYDIANPGIKYNYEVSIDGIEVVEKTVTNPTEIEKINICNRLISYRDRRSDNDDISKYYTSGDESIYSMIYHNEFLDDGTVVNSYSKISKNIIILFKLHRFAYDNSNASPLLLRSVKKCLGKKELKVNIKKIK